MNTQSEIDQALRQLGAVEPPPGLQQRIQRGLHKTPRRFSLSVVYGVSGGALAAGVAAFAIALNPSLHRRVFAHPGPASTVGESGAPRVAPVAGGFGASGAVRVPVEPVPVQPTPINQGRGRSRPGRATLPAGSAAPLPRGVEPSQPMARTGTSDR